MNLVVVESPAKAKTINKYLGKDFKVVASVGHIRNLPKSKLGIEIEDGFKPKYTLIKGKKKIVDEIKKLARKSEKVFLASDPDREGEAIAWHIAEMIQDKKFNGELYRVQFNEITKKAILNAFSEPGTININRVDAQTARRILDRLVGYIVSPILWKVLYYGLSAGRVQSVALKLVCEREKEIADFNPEEYWSIEVDLLTKDDQPFTVKLLKKNNKKLEIKSQKEAEEITSDLEKASYLVKEIKKSKKIRRPYAPFITSTMQQDASSKIGFAPAKTMRIAQQLYEGVELGKQGNTALITYMRTDSTRVSDEALSNVREYIKNRYGKELLPKNPNIYSKKKGKVQDGHEAVRPTYMDYPPEKVKDHLNKDQLKLYTLIWNRFVASQMKTAEYEVHTADITADDKYLLRITGSILKFMGFLSVYGFDEKEQNKFSIPEMTENEKLKLEKVNPNQHFTKPPPRFTEASLIKELEKDGIGRPSTYALIISTIIQREYVSKISKALKATDLGMTVNRLLDEMFPEIFNVKFTAEMEEKLDKIESGDAERIEVLKNFYQPFNKKVEEIEPKTKEIKESLTEKTNDVCPKCGEGELLVKWGRNGRFIACSNYPKCRYTKAIDEPDEKTEEKCPDCGGEMTVKKGRYGKFLACKRYPECKGIKPYTLDIQCPKCKTGKIVQRRSKRGRTFYGCSNYPDCDFVSWYKPVNQKCSNCGNDYLVEKSNDSGKFKQCLKCKTKFPYE